MQLGHVIELTCQWIAGIMVTFGVVVMVVGTIRSIFRYVAYEKECGTESMGGRGLDRIRGDFGAYLLLGLEFSVAADIILTLIEPDYKGLIILGGLVVIRTVISHFIGRERADIESELAANASPS